MSFRVSALVAVVGVLALGSVSPAFGQPAVPPRPRTTPFGAIFSPPLAQQQIQQQQIFNQAMGGGVAPGLGLGPLFGGAPGLSVGPLAYQSAFPGAFAPAALPGAPTGVVGSFGNLGHWYPPPGAAGGGSGNYGHWYPNGIGVAGGRGVAGSGGGGSGLSGGLYGGAAVNPGGGGSGALRNAAGTAAGAGAAAGQMRR
jgi:hypothetical protein